MINQRKIYKQLLSISTQLRSCHWNTRKFVVHHYGDIATEIDEKIDEFIESCQGKTGELMLTPGDDPISITVHAEELNGSMVGEMIETLDGILISVRNWSSDSGPNNEELEDILNDIRNILNTLNFHLALQ